MAFVAVGTLASMPRAATKAVRPDPNKTSSGIKNTGFHRGFYLCREEGAQGLIHLARRTATCMLQFVQRLLTGPADLVWRELASCVFRRVSGLELDAVLFLILSKCVNLNGSPPFFPGCF